MAQAAMPASPFISTALYIRLSVEDGDLTGGSKVESNSVVNQRMLLSEFIQSREDLTGCRVVEFCDDGYTGTNFERPGFQEMMYCCQGFISVWQGVSGCE